jgi:16S rRNA (cytosine1402-N4)-methyltransferase
MSIATRRKCNNIIHWWRISTIITMSMACAAATAAASAASRRMMMRPSAFCTPSRAGAALSRSAQRTHIPVHHIHSARPLSTSSYTSPASASATNLYAAKKRGGTTTSEEEDSETTTLTTASEESQDADANKIQSYATEYHAPVMAKECIDALLECRRGRPREVEAGDSTSASPPPLWFVDGTLGGGGHSQALLERLSAQDVVFGLDVDPDALYTASQRLAKYLPSSHPLHQKEENDVDLPLFIPVQTNFRDASQILPRIMAEHQLHLALESSSDDTDMPPNQVDGILLDLGVSSHQIDCSERGFAFQQDGPLDMRMNAGKGEDGVVAEKDDNDNTNTNNTNTTTARPGGVTAANICNEYPESELSWMFRTYGDEPRARAIAKAIVSRRPLVRTSDLVNAVAEVTPQFSRKSRRGGRSATCARIFQSLRIVVNREEEALRSAFEDMAPTIVRTGGRLVVLSYHSMEDRMSKRIMRDGLLDKKKGGFMVQRDVYGNELGPAKPWVPVGKRQKARLDEVEQNSRARSATLRVAERQNENDELSTTN